VKSCSQQALLEVKTTFSALLYAIFHAGYRGGFTGFPNTHMYQMMDLRAT